MQHGSDYQIMLDEDDPKIAGILAEALQPYGYTVRV